MKLNRRNKSASPVFYCTIRENTGVTCARIPHIQRLVYSDLLKPLKKTAHPHITNTPFPLLGVLFISPDFGFGAVGHLLIFTKLTAYLFRISCPEAVQEKISIVPAELYFIKVGYLAKRVMRKTSAAESCSPI